MIKMNELGGGEEEEDTDDDVEHNTAQEALRSAREVLDLEDLELDEEERESSSHCHCNCKMFEGKPCIQQFSDKQAEQIRYLSCSS